MRAPFLVPILVPMIFASTFAVNGVALAGSELPTLLVIHGKQFEPNKLELPAGAKVKMVIRNLDELPVEFESSDLSREVIVAGHGEVTIFVGPLEPGSYQFFNDFNHDMQGTILVKPAISKEK